MRGRGGGDGLGVTGVFIDDSYSGIGFGQVFICLGLKGVPEVKVWKGTIRGSQNSALFEEEYRQYLQ